MSSQMKKFKIANIGLALIGVCLGTPLLAHSDEIVCGTTYVVERGDSLSNISEWAYGTSRRVDEIYAANAEQIGPDRSVLFLGMELIIPCIEGEELMAGSADTEAAEQSEAVAAEAEAEAEAEAAAEQAEAEAAAALAAAEVAAAAEALAAAQEAAAKAAEALAAAEAAAAKEAEDEAAVATEASASEADASANANEDSAEDLMAMSEELLTIEGFDADKVIALIETLDIPDSEKTTLSNAVIAAEDNPAWLSAMLGIISNKISR